MDEREGKLLGGFTSQAAITMSSDRHRRRSRNEASNVQQNKGRFTIPSMEPKSSHSLTGYYKSLEE
jgi:hypothetical protein